MLLIRFFHSRFVDQHCKDGGFHTDSKEKRGIGSRFLHKIHKQLNIKNKQTVNLKAN